MGVSPFKREEGVRVPDPVGPTAEGERRYLSVLFCDLVNSTPIASSIDPEDYSELMVYFHAFASQAIEAAGGYVAQHLGDGLLAYFGFPQATEQDAERACHCGLELLGSLPGLNERFAPICGQPLQMRVGIHTGLLVVNRVGAGDSSEVLALGGATNIAARVQSAAEPNSVWITETVYQRVRRRYVTQDQGQHQLKGVGEAIQLYRIAQMRGLDAELVGDHTRLSPICGRDREREALRTAFEQAQESKGGLLLLRGEAGIGKSRLVHALREDIRELNHVWLPLRAAEYHQQSALFPLIQMQRELLGFGSLTSNAQKLSRLEQAAQEAGLDVSTSVPVAASLHELPLDGRFPQLNLTPLGLRKKTFEVLREWLFSLCRGTTVVLAVEDLHWLDPSSLELLASLVNQAERARLLVLTTARSEFSSEEASLHPTKVLNLQNLNEQAMRQLILQNQPELVGSEEAVQLAVERSHGIPLYGEAMAHVIAQQTTADSPDCDLQLPHDLEESLLARLETADRVKEVAQLAAVIGFRFSLSLLQTLWEQPKEELSSALRRAEDCGVLFRIEGAEGTLYGFRHALFRDAAYHSLIRKSRRRYHLMLADALKGGLRPIAESQPELLGHHLAQAGDLTSAVAAFAQAGTKALVKGSLKEAIALYRRALHHLGTSDDQAELDLQHGLARALVLDRGWAHNETQAAWERAAALCDRAQSPLRWGAIECGLGDVYSSRELPRSLQLFEELVGFGQHHRITLHEIAGHQGAALALYYLGRFVEARDHLDQGIALYDQEQHRFYEAGFHEEKSVNLFAWSAWIHGMLGNIETARKDAKRAIEIAAQHQNHFGLSFALNWAGALEIYLRNWDEARSYYQKSRSIAVEQGFVAIEALSGIGIATADGVQHLAPDATKIIQDHMALFQGTGNQLGGPVLIGLLTDVFLAQSQWDSALKSVEMALSVSAATGQPVFDPWLLCMRAEALNAKFGYGDPKLNQETEALLAQAAQLAQEQQVRLFQVPVATAQARHKIAQGKIDEARELLDMALSAIPEPNAAILKCAWQLKQQLDPK